MILYQTVARGIPSATKGRDDGSFFPEPSIVSNENEGTFNPQSLQM
jgi:hypothetical protein